MHFRVNKYQYYLQPLGEFHQSVQLKDLLSPGYSQGLPFSPVDELPLFLFCPGQSLADYNRKNVITSSTTRDQEQYPHSTTIQCMEHKASFFLLTLKKKSLQIITMHNKQDFVYIYNLLNYITFIIKAFVLL